MILKRWLLAAAGVCALVPALAFAQAVGVPDFNIANAIPNALLYSNGAQAPIQGFVLINPNNKSPCVVGNTGCSLSINGGGAGGAVTVAQLPSGLGSTTKSGSLSVTFASDQTLPAFAAPPTFNIGTGGPVGYALETGNLSAAKADLDLLVAAISNTSPVSQSGTWTVQPGNTANTTPWLTTDSATAPTGGAAPAKAAFMGANVGGNLTGLQACGSTAIYDASTSGETQIIALSGSTVTYICGYTILAAGTVNVNLAYGTGSNCATSPTKITPAYQLTAQVGAVDGSPFYRGLQAPAGKETCLNASGGVAVQAIVYYDQH